MIDRIPREWLDRVLGYAMIAAPGFCLALAPVTYWWLGSWPAVRFVALYVTPIALMAPWWLRERLRTVPLVGVRGLVPRLIDGAVLLLAVARFGVGTTFPFSGHMLFLTHSVLTTPVKRYQWTAAALIIETSIFKLLVWQDVMSWAIGLGAGLVTASLHWVSMRHIERHERP